MPFLIPVGAAGAAAAGTAGAMGSAAAFGASTAAATAGFTAASAATTATLAGAAAAGTISTGALIGGGAAAATALTVGGVLSTIGTYAAIASSVVGLASTAYTVLNPPQQQMAIPKLYQAQGFAQMPVVPQLKLGELAPIPIPTFNANGQPLPPSSAENIIRVDQNQSHRIGQTRAAYFTGEQPYKQQTTGAMDVTSMNESNKDNLTAYDQVLGG